VDNAAQAHVRALDALRGGRDCAGKTYFISNDDPRPQKDIIAGLLAAAGLQTEIRALSPVLVGALATVIEATWRVLRLDSEPPLTRWSAAQLSTAHWYDISAAKRDLEYQPLVSIDEGLRRLREQMGGG
jgi:nucleoside-diphosphate-sugar epimerase